MWPEYRHRISPEKEINRAYDLGKKNYGAISRNLCNHCRLLMPLIKSLVKGSLSCGDDGLYEEVL